MDPLPRIQHVNSSFSMAIILTGENFTKSFGSGEAVAAVAMDIQQGEIRGV
jgi:hypothetical protein